MDLVIRTAELADAAAIAEVHVRSWQAAYDGLLPADQLAAVSVDARTQRWEANLDDSAPQRRTMLAVSGRGRVVGFASIGPSRDADASPGTGELWAIYLHPDEFSTGAGNRLHAMAIDALAASYVEATLWVLSGNARARAFYERHGWAPDGASKVEEFLTAMVDEVRYRRPLS